MKVFLPNRRLREILFLSVEETKNCSRKKKAMGYLRYRWSRNKSRKQEEEKRKEILNNF